MSGPTQSFILRVEGVNLAQLLGDTDQISVIRGASMALRDVGKKVENWLQEKTSPVMAIQNGASVGLFRFDADQGMARHCRQHIADCLNQDALYRYFTFVVDVQPMQDFDKDREKALAKNRFRQLRQPTVSIPEINADNTQPCELDGLRPSVVEVNIGKEGKRVSESVSQRLRYGRDQKKRFYERETGQQIDLGFTTDLGEIAEDERYGNLNGKLAYLYFDGNGFGGIQKEHCRGIDGHIEFDQYIQA